MINKLSPKFLISFFIVVLPLAGCINNPDKTKENNQNSLKENIGEKFILANILDSTGNIVELNLNSAEITIIDFWNNSCPPCIEEMRQFSALLLHKPQISIISISVNQFWLWKPTLAEHKNRFSFLNNKTPNWRHYTLQSNEDPKLKNEFSIDRIEELEKRYNVAFFPSYLVVDRNGIIQSRPESAVAFIKQFN